MGYDCTLMNRLSGADIVFYFTILSYGCGAVQYKVEILVSRNAYGEGVGAEHAVHTPGGGYRWAGVCACDADAALL